jgi:hypothetical protein
LPALAVTDRDGVYGIVRAHVKARELGLKLIVGSLITLEDESVISFGSRQTRLCEPLPDFDGRGGCDLKKARVWSCGTKFAGMATGSLRFGAAIRA